MAAVSFFTYNYTQNIMANQIEEIIDLASGEWLNTFFNKSALLRENNRMFDSAEFEYITTRNGMI